MTVADSKYRLEYVNVGSFGKDCDPSIFKQSTLWQLTLTNSLQLPEEKCLPGTESPKVPYYFVGDEAFGLHTHLMRPYGRTHLMLEKRTFNYHLCMARCYVECAFRILSNKWRIFHRPRPINVELDVAVYNEKACNVLHNFVRDRDGYLPEDTTKISGLEDLPKEPTARGGLQANNVQKILSKYFVTHIGAVSWQMSKI